MLCIYYTFESTTRLLENNVFTQYVCARDPVQLQLQVGSAAHSVQAHVAATAHSQTVQNSPFAEPPAAPGMGPCGAKGSLILLVTDQSLPYGV
jgi:hypothetical protein